MGFVIIAHFLREQFEIVFMFKPLIDLVDFIKKCGLNYFLGVYFPFVVQVEQVWNLAYGP